MHTYLIPKKEKIISQQVNGLTCSAPQYFLVSCLMTYTTAMLLLVPVVSPKQGVRYLLLGYWLGNP